MAQVTSPAGERNCNQSIMKYFTCDQKLTDSHLSYHTRPKLL